MRFLLPAFVAGALSCGAISSGDPAIQPELEFTVLGAAPAGGPDSAAVARVEAGEATVEGVMSTPNPCYELQAELSADARVLTVTLTATAMPRICAQVIAAFRYRAQIHHLEPGTYRVQLRHRYPSTGWEGKDYEMRLEIPG